MHDVMLTSLIVIHLLKFNMWHYVDFWTNYYYFEILKFIVHYDYE